MSDSFRKGPLSLGVLTVLVGYLISILVSSFIPDLPQVCKDWNKYNIMELTLFLTGYIVYYLY